MNDPHPPPDRHTIVITVLTAAATTLAAELVGWAIDELRAKYGSKPEPEEK